MWLGEFDLSSIVYFKFTTRGTTGAPATLAGTPALSVYKTNSTTESTAGVTLTVDFDSRTGFNHVAIDTSADGTFYATATDFAVVITTGTVGGTSVVGEVVGHFTIRNRAGLKPTTAGRTLVVDASGLADANVVKLGPTGSGTAQTARDIGASVLLDNTQSILSAPAANTVGEALYMADIFRGRFGTAQAGTSTTITLDASASAADGRYVGYSCFLSGGTGGGLPGTAGQERTIVAYNGTTKVATVAQAWGTNPDATTVFKLIANPKVDIYCWAGDNAGISVDANHLPKVDTEDWKGAAAAAMTGDAFARLGAPAGASVSADMAAVKSDTGTLTTRISGTITITSGGVLAHSVDTGGITAASFAAAAITATVAPNLDAAVSSRSTYAGADTSGTTTLLTRIGGTITLNAGAVTVGTNSDKTGYALTSGERTSIVAALFATVTESTETFIQAFRVMRAALVGKISGAAGTSIAIRDAADTKDRIAAVVDSSGNRTSVTTDGT